MADTEKQELSPNDKLDEEGNVVAQDPEKVGERVSKLLHGDPKDAPKLTGVKVLVEWTNERNGKPPHPKGEVVSLSDIKMSEGNIKAVIAAAKRRDPESKLTEADVREQYVTRQLIPLGLVEPQYEKGTEPPKTEVEPNLAVVDPTLPAFRDTSLDVTSEGDANKSTQVPTRTRRTEEAA